MSPLIHRWAVGIAGVFLLFRAPVCASSKGNMPIIAVVPATSKNGSWPTEDAVSQRLQTPLLVLDITRKI